MAEFKLPADLLALFENDPMFEAMLNVMIKNINFLASRLIFWSLSLSFSNRTLTQSFSWRTPKLLSVLRLYV